MNHNTIPDVNSDSDKLMDGEPDHANFSALLNNISANRLYNVRPFRMALSNEDRTGNLYLSSDNLGDHRIDPVEGRRSVPIEIARLDSVLADSSFRPDLVKIDIQGAELDALKGAEDTLKNAGTSCAKIIEFWPGGMKGGLLEAEALADLIFSWNQDVYVFHHEGTGSIRKIDPPTMSRAINGCIHPDEPSYIDLLVAPRDDRMGKIVDYIGPQWEPWK